MADVPVRFAGLRGTLAAFAVDLFAGRVGSITDAPMCSGGYDRWGVYDGSAWRLGPASDYAGNANVLSLLVNGTSVIDSSRNVKGATLWSNGAIRIDANGDFTGRNQTLTGWMTLNGATRPAWGSGFPAIAIGGTSSLCSSETGNGSQPSLISNWYFDGAKNVAISTHAASNFPRAFVLRDDGAFVGYSSITPPTAGSTVTDLAVRWQFNRFGSLGCFGVTPPTTRPTVNAAATDLATVIALTNQLRSALIACGLVQ